MRTQTRSFRPIAKTCLTGIFSLSIAAIQPVVAQSTGFNQSGAGPFDYNNNANWGGGTINGIWAPTLTLTATQTTTFAANTTATSGLSFRYAGGFAENLRSTGGNFTLTLGGDILVGTANNQTVTIGNTANNQRLAVDLDGGIRTFTVFGQGNGGNFGRSLVFVNAVSNGGIIASGGGTGGGLVRLDNVTNTLASATVLGADLSFNGAANSGANTVNTITDALTGGQGASTVTVTANGARHSLVSAGSLARNAGSTLLFRGTNLGVNTISSATVGSSNVQLAVAPTALLLGGSGAAGTSTVNILAGAFGDTSSSGSGLGATGGLVTYDSTYGVRLLAANEYTTSITDGQTQLDNVRITNSSGAITTTTLTTALLPVTTINSLSLEVSGATGNQGITLTGDSGTTLKINSGVIYAKQNVTTGSSPAVTDAMTINVPTLDLNGKEGIILINTTLNSGGTADSNGALIINSAITNGTGLTIADPVGTNVGGMVVLGGSTANTYTGNTTINGAIVRFNKSIANSFGDLVLNLGSVYNTGNQFTDTSNLTVNGGTYFLNNSNNSGTATSETIANLTMTGGSISPGSGTGNTLTVNGDASLSGGTIGLAQNAKLIIGGTTNLSGGVISAGTNNSASVYNSKVTLTGPVNITNTAQGSAAYTPITIAAGASSGNRGGQVELSGDVTFTGNNNTNTVTIAAPSGTGLKGVMALNGVCTFTIGNGAASSDLTIEAALIDGTATGGLTKTGLGTLALSAVNSYTGATNVNQGILLLGVANALSASSPVSMNGGTLNTGGFSQTLGTVALSAHSTIDLGTTGDVALLFAASNGITWTGSVSLGFINVDANDSIRFGASSGALTSDQLAQITINGFAATIDGNGFLTAATIPEPSAYAFFAGIGLLTVAGIRRRARRT